MTRYSEEERAKLEVDAIGRVVTEMIYDAEDDYYYTITFDNEMEFSFRFMADLVP